MMSKSLRNQLTYAVIFIVGVIFLFIFLAENMHKIEYAIHGKNLIVEYKPVRVASQVAHQTYHLETYQLDSTKPLVESKSLNKNKKIQGKYKDLKDLGESNIVDHQIFASPNNIRSKRIFI